MATYDPDRAAAIMYPELASLREPVSAPTPPVGDATSRIADRMYPPQDTAQGSAAVGSAPAPEKPIEEDPDSAADAMYPGDGSPPSDGDYAPMVAEVFDDLERRARLANADEDLAAIAEGRTQVTAALQELGVGAAGARELGVVLGRFHHEPATDGGIEAANAYGHKHLQEAWGRKYEQNLAHARAGYQEVIRRVPWLKDEIENGAGSDPAVIKHFTAIGRRLSSKARK